MTAWMFAALAALVTALVVYRLAPMRRERFSFGGLWDKVKDKAGDVADLAKKKGSLSGEQPAPQPASQPAPQPVAQPTPAPQPAYTPTFVARVRDGADWACPANTVDNGAADNAKACISSQFHPPVWRWNGKEWGWGCQNGTTPTSQEIWEKKCEVGYTTRVMSGGTWQCPTGTTDTKKNWDNADWFEAHKQCKRSSPYTGKITDEKGAAVCPGGSKDTGRATNPCKWGP